jgi:virginiamycin B lyase
MEAATMLRKIVSLVSIGIVLLASVAFAADPKVTIKEWDTKTTGAFPHDPCVAPDGALWYTGMAANVLVRLDVKSGEIKEYPLKTPKSGPHGLVADKEGNIWFTANTKAYIGKLDPKTGNVTEYPMPDANARDPHSLVFDQRGTLWFTVQGTNFVGKLEPRTGKIELKQRD